MNRIICLLPLLLATSLSAQQRPAETASPAVAADAYRVLPPVKLYPGVAPGSESWTIPESTSGQAPGRIVRNVLSPDYVPYLPDASRNTGTAVVIAPGGGFVMLSLAMFTAYRNGKGVAELHVFQMGAHGFVNKGGGADHFMDRLEEWLRANKVLASK